MHHKDLLAFTYLCPTQQHKDIDLVLGDWLEATWESARVL